MPRAQMDDDHPQTRRLQLKTAALWPLAVPVGSRASYRATRGAPIVAIDLETDPIGAGLAATWSQPGGRVTGLFLDQLSLAGKAFELLDRVSPRLDLPRACSCRGTR